MIVSSWSGGTGYLDNVQVTFTAVPEPATTSLLFAGLASVWLVRWRRANRHVR